MSKCGGRWGFAVVFFLSFLPPLSTGFSSCVFFTPSPISSSPHLHFFFDWVQCHLCDETVTSFVAEVFSTRFFLFCVVWFFSCVFFLPRVVVCCSEFCRELMRLQILFLNMNLALVIFYIDFHIFSFSVSFPCLFVCSVLYFFLFSFFSLSLKKNVLFVCLFV